MEREREGEKGRKLIIDVALVPTLVPAAPSISQRHLAVIEIKATATPAAKLKGETADCLSPR